MSQITAASIMTEARILSRRTDRKELPNGWVSELGHYPEGVNARDLLNIVLRELSAKGVLLCWYSFDIVADQQTYNSTKQMGEVVRSILVIPNGSNNREWPVEETTQTWLDDNRIGWNLRKSSIITHFYPIGTKTVGVYPISTRSDVTLKLLAHSQIGPVDEGTDIIGEVTTALGVPILEASGDTASIIPEGMVGAITYKLAAYMARAFTDWPMYGNLMKMAKAETEGLESYAGSKTSVNPSDLQVDVRSMGKSRG